MRILVRCAAAFLVILQVGGCAARKAPPPSPAPGASVPPPAVPVRPPPPPPAPPAPAPPAEANYLEGLAMMNQGKFERALELFAAAWKETPGHPGVEENFPAALEGLKRSGDEAQRQGRPEEAGKRWTASMKFLSHPALKGRSLSVSRAELKAAVDRQSENLMEKGLQDYRQGRLEAAIATWRQILAYDPGHEEAAKSVKTATTQLENLKKLTPPPPAK